MYLSVVAKVPDSKLDNLLASLDLYAMHTLEEGVAKVCEILSCTSKTSQLWLNYQHFESSLDSIEGGSNRIMEYVSQLSSNIRCSLGFQLLDIGLTLPASTNPVVISQFIKGLHVVRRTDKYWAGLGCDMVIEQTRLMRTLKSNEGITRGSGMSHEQRIVCMSLPVSSMYNLTMQPGI